MNPFLPSGPFLSAWSTALDYAPYGGADAGECLRVAEQIREGDCESWHLIWIGLAEQVRRDASETLSAGRNREARDAFLRAAHYYRTSGLFLPQNPNDARIATTAQASSACFATAMRLSTPPSEVLRIEGAETPLTGTAYLHRCGEAPRPRATVLVVGVGNVTPLEAYFSCAVAATRCGWNCLTESTGDTGDDRDVLPFAQSLLSLADGHVALDPACLALLILREEPPSPPDWRVRRSARPWAMGDVGTLRRSLARHHGDSAPRGSTDVETTGTLAGLHQHLYRWLEPAK